MSELEWLIIADDLTGACDAGVQFARLGLRASVLLAEEAPPAGVQVAAVSSESRNLGEGDAAAAVAAIARWLGAREVMKKIDSVLRGHPGAEIAAARKAFGYEAAVATPAFPAMGRVVDGGNRAEVAGRLRSDAHVGPDGVAEALRAGARVVSADAASDADLDAIVAGGRASGRRILWAGSGGLAAALARQCGSEESGRRAVERLGRRGVVFCIGSDHAVTVEQVAELRRARPESVVVGPGEMAECGALVLSGGDTAAAVCREAGVRRIDLAAEVLPGIPWGILRCGRLDGVPVVTKSGGFGRADALVRVAEFLA